MADTTLLLQFLRELDVKYEGKGGWGSLDENHPDIKKAQALNPFYEKTKRAGGKKSIWTPEKDEFIKQNYLKMSDEELSKELKVAVSTLKTRRRKLKCNHPRLHAQQVTVEATDKDGNVIAVYSSISRASDELSIGRRAIARALKTSEPVCGVYLREVVGNGR